MGTLPENLRGRCNDGYEQYKPIAGPRIDGAAPAEGHGSGGGRFKKAMRCAGDYPTTAIDDLRRPRVGGNHNGYAIFHRPHHGHEIVLPGRGGWPEPDVIGQLDEELGSCIDGFARQVREYIFPADQGGDRQAWGDGEQLDCVARRQVGDARSQPVRIDLRGLHFPARR